MTDAQADPQAEPARAEEVLAAVAAAGYPAGSTVTLAMISEVGCVNEFDGGPDPPLGAIGRPLGICGR